MKKTIALILALVMMLSIVTVAPISTSAAETDSAQTGETIYSGDYKYEVLPDGTAKLTGYNGYGTSVTVPDKIDGRKVTVIGEYMFANNFFLTSVTLPDTITKIEKNAFYYVPGLQSVNIPKYVTYIGDYAFAYCEKITEAHIPDTCTYLGAYAFENCKALSAITLGNSISSIGNYAFYGCDKITEIEIPDSVTSIGSSAFASSGLTEVTVPESVESIGSGAFGYCSNLGEITIENPDCEINENPNTFPSNATIIAPAGSTAQEYAENNGMKFDEFKVPGSDKVYTYGDLKYRILSDGTVEITMYTGEKNHLRIPPEINGRVVTSIGDYAFSGNTTLVYLNIDAEVTSVGDYAFYNCKALKYVNDCNFTSVGEKAFAGCTKLENLYMYNITSMGYAAFMDCESLESISISDSLVEIPDYAFYNCSSLKYSVYLGENTERVGAYAFAGCKNIEGFAALQGEDYDQRLNYIGEYAFLNCTNLRSVQLSEYATTIEKGAFKGCNKIEQFIIYNGDSAFYPNDDTVPKRAEYIVYKDSAIETFLKNNGYTYHYPWYYETVTSECGFYDYRFLGDGTIEIVEFNNTKFNDDLYNGWFVQNIYYIGDYVVPSTIDGYTVTSIGERAYENYSGGYASGYWKVISYDSITIPDTVTHIGKYAFVDCDFKKITFGKNVKIIEDYAFGYEHDGCYRVTEFNFPASVEYISPYFHDGDGALTKITVDPANPVYDSRNNCNAIIETATNTLVYGYKNTVIPDTVEHIGDYAFYQRNGFSEITIPASVVSIGYYAFFGNYDLKKVDVFAKNIGECAFYNTGITELTLGNSVEYIGDSAFNGTYITELNIPDSVITIGNSAFSSCKQLASVTFGNSLEVIEGSAFHECDSLTELVFPDSLIAIEDHVFYYCDKLAKVDIPSTVKYIGPETFASCPELYAIGLPNSCGIGYHQFANSDKIKELVVPETVESIDHCAFDIDNLEKIVIYNRDCEFIDITDYDIGKNATIYGWLNSTAHEYATKYDRKFVPLDELEPEVPDEPEKENPKKVENVHASLVTHNAFTIEWDALEGATKYWVYVTEDGKPFGAACGSTTGTSYVIKNSEPGVTYKVCVTAKLEDGTILKIEDADVLTLSVATKVENIVVHDSDSEFKIHLSWDPVDGAQGYRVFVDNAPYIRVDTNSVVIENRKPDTLYYIRIVPVFGNGGHADQKYANVVAVRTDDQGPFTSTTKYSFPMDEEAKGQSVAWLKVGKSPDNLDIVKRIEITDIDSYDLAGLDYGTDYYYTWTCKRASGGYEPSEVFHIKTEENTYNTIDVTYTTEGKAVINWNVINKAHLYKVYVVTDKGNKKIAEQKGNSAVTIDNYKDGDVIKITGYYYKKQGVTDKIEYKPATLKK